MAILDKGVYVFKDTMDFSWITSNKFISFDFYIFDESNNKLSYTDFNVYKDTLKIEYNAFDYYDDGWLETYAKTIYIEEDINILDSEFYNFIYHNCEKINFVLSYNTNGGVYIPPTHEVYEITSLPTPIKEGNEFLGWYYENTFVTEVEIGDYITEDTTIYAKWLPVYTVEYNSLGGTPVSTLTGQTEITYLPTIVKTGYDFLGWYYEISFNNQARIGDTLTQNVVLYAKWKYKGSFDMTFYNNTIEDIRVNKTNYLLNATNGTGYIREPTSIVNMSVMVEYSGVFNFNYCYIPYFNRYYYITDIENCLVNLWRVHLKCDVLMTYKDYIKSQEAYILRQENVYNADVIDPITSYEQEPIILTQKVNTTPFETDSDTNSVYAYVINVVKREN